MVHKTVYLAGPITGLNYDDATDWRTRAKRALALDGIKAVDPLRSKVYLRDETAIAMDYPDHEDEFAKLMSNSRGITTRDRFDCMNCDVLFVNLLGATQVSIGTVMEIAWADSRRTPIVLVIEDDQNVHDHPMICECVGFRVTTLKQGIDVVRSILGVY